MSEAALKDRGYFSAEICACGCENLLPQRVLDNGNKFLWGHKGRLKGVAHNKPQLGTIPAPRTKPGTSVNMEGINEFITAQLELAKQELKKAEDESEKIKYTTTALKQKIDKLSKVRNDLKEL